ncbi:MAG TPA: glycosyl transferase family 36 [Rhodanobacteraceae bacterium]|nr:glycosyl transferase family 36 [Rhodanobacteraceae bacterium]
MSSQGCPRTTLLANGEYAVMLTDAGSGYSRWRDLAITRWREDTTCDPWGSWFYLRDVHGGKERHLWPGAPWSSTVQPLGPDDSQRECHLLEHAALYAHRDGDLTTTLEVALHGSDALEIRGIGLRNDGDTPREIEITSYAELVLGNQQGDASHPAFSKMFVQTHREGDVLLATRRKRDPPEPDVWAAHGVVVDGEALGAAQWETDRLAFIGRDRTPRSPQALDEGAKLSGTVGTVLDPIFSLRVRVRVPARSTRRVAFLTAAAAKRDEVLELVSRNANVGACADVFAKARGECASRLRSLGISDEEARDFRRLADALLYSDPALRAAPGVLAQGEGGAPVLWAKGISGDLPIVLLRLGDTSQSSLLQQLLSAQAYWRSRQLPADLVVLNEASGDAAASLQQQLEALTAQAADGKPDKAQGSVFVLRGDQVDNRLRNGLLTVARIVLDGKNGELKAQIARLPRPNGFQNPSSRPRSSRPWMAALGRDPEPWRVKPLDPGLRRDDEHKHYARASFSSERKSEQLEDFNGLGGFSADGLEYVTVLRDGQSTPMPWSQLVANPDFGFLATTTGGGYCWAVNSQQNQITHWSNDPVCDPPSEVLYLRDTETGALWSATASPIRVQDSTYVARFGPGYAKFETVAHGIESELLQFVPVAGCIKVSRLRLRNRSGRARTLDVTAYVRWALGAIGTDAAPFGITSFDKQANALLASNRWRDPLADRVAFAAFDKAPDSCTGDRGEFLGRHGALEAPAALTGEQPLSNHTGAGLDPCAALQTHVELAPDGEAEIVFMLGEGADRVQALDLVRHWRGADLDTAFAEVQEQWNATLDAVQVRTPDPQMDRLLNRCLLYQVLACRLWARTAFYQASGAYGFRDQLQDVGALCVARPDLAREHILRAAARQFVEGDVQHWWLPPDGRGVRTRMTDDRLWLPYILAHYMRTTGDTRVLDEDVPFVQGDVLKPGETDSFFAPQAARESGTLFEHCARAIEVSMQNGAHGLPLMGTGDWNDGMNRVGIGGKGESVWLGWFLCDVLEEFVTIAEQRGETQRAQAWRKHADDLRDALDRAWDGEWYRRAYYDDGTPLGSRGNRECMIDSLAQSWSVISGDGEPARAERAMRAVGERLVREEDGLVALFTPPFDRTKHDPGYIKGYPPGLRENGGQYTHGSIWSAIAFAMLGEGDTAHQLFRIFDPLRHTQSPEGTERYKVEPYVACADVYSVEPHVGRGGWTWYSGSAGWLYRAGLEWLLGFRLQGDTLRMEPCIPKPWNGFEVEYRHGSSRYTIEVENPDHVCRGVARVELDGEKVNDANAIPLKDDGAIHHIKMTLGP